MFAQPYRVLKTDSTDSNTLMYYDNAMESMASRAWARLKKEDELEFMSGDSKGNGYKAYDNLEMRMEKKISKLILGHADAIDSTPGKLGGQGSKGIDSMSEVQNSLMEIQQADQVFVENVINCQLIPKLRNLGIMIPEDLKFEFLNDMEHQKMMSRQNDENVKIADYVTKFKKAGYEIDSTMLEERTGLKFTEIEEVEVEKEEETDVKSVKDLRNVNNFNTDEIPMHKNCKCSIDDFTNEWLLGQSDSGPCDTCRDAAEMWNNAIREGRIDDADMIWNAHKGL
jgi:hypothetical protein